MKSITHCILLLFLILSTACNSQTNEEKDVLSQEAIAWMTGEGNRLAQTLGGKLKVVEAYKVDGKSSEVSGTKTYEYWGEIKEEVVQPLVAKVPFTGSSCVNFQTTPVDSYSTALESRFIGIQAGAAIVQKVYFIFEERDSGWKMVKKKCDGWTYTQGMGQELNSASEVNRIVNQPVAVPQSYTATRPVPTERRVVAPDDPEIAELVKSPATTKENMWNTGDGYYGVVSPFGIIANDEQWELIQFLANKKWVSKKSYIILHGTGAWEWKNTKKGKEKSGDNWVVATEEGFEKLKLRNGMTFEKELIGISPFFSKNTMTIGITRYKGEELE